MKRLACAALLLAMVPVPTFAGDANQEYTVEVYMDRITVLKVVEGPLDTQEDLHGNITIRVIRWPEDTIGRVRYPAPATLGGGTLWSKDSGRSLVLGAGQSKSYGNFMGISGPGLTKRQVLNLEFGVSGEMMDWEPLGSINYKECDQCGAGMRMMRLTNYASQIEAIQPGGSRYLTIGSDTTFQLDWYEGDANSSHVRALMKIKVLRK
ncbi:MAG: hypothetical protein NT117_03175 [Gammaproteobacteria bacterium]|nr:hypothetical protein [Gammaproteobacteria bacterium]